MPVRKEKDFKREKMVLLTGTVLIFVTALIGSQFLVLGKVYFEKLEYVERQKYELNGTLKWADYEEWIEELRQDFKGKVNTEVKQVEDWSEWYALLKKAEHAPVYDDSLYGPVFHDDEGFVLWFNMIDSRGSERRGTLTTVVIIPDR